MATLTSTKIKNTYDALLKSIDNDAIGTTAKQITDGLGNLTPLYISTTQIGIGVTPESGLNLHVFGDAKIGSNLTIIGNLVVEGSTTTVGTDTLTVKDPLIVLANNNTSTDAVDIGFYGKYTPSGTTLYSGLFREALTGKYRLFKDLQVEPTTTVNTSGTGYAKAHLVIGELEATTGRFSGYVNIDGVLDVDDAISVEGSAFGRIEIGGASGGYIDLKAPNSDDYDFRIITSSGGNEITTATGDLIFNTAETLALTIDTSQDATFEGNIILSGTVDGRDVAADGTKLDGIEAGADVTDAANVLAAGAVMTTGNQSIAGEKTFSDDFTVTSDAVFNGNINLDDDEALNFGTSNAFNLRWSTTAASGQGASIIDSGRIFIETNFFQLNSRTGESMIRATSNSDVELYYNDSKKLETTSTGVYVTGSGVFTQDLWINTGQKLFFDNGSDCYISEDTTGRLKFVVDGSEFMRLGDGIPDTITFYKDSTFTGDLIVDTDTLFVDASEDSVGINTANPSSYSKHELVITAPDDGGVTIASATDEAAFLDFSDGSGVKNFIRVDHDGDTFGYNSWGSHLFTLGEGVPSLTLESSGATFADNATFEGNIRISKTDATLEINNSLASLTNADLYISVEDTGQADVRQYGAYPLAFWTNNVERLTIDSSGNATFGGNVNTGRLFVEQSGADMIDMTRTGIGTYRFAISGSDAFSLFDVGANADRLIIDSSGNVGIGTTSPDGNLEVVGTTVISTVSDGVNAVLIGLAGSNRTTIQFDTADTTHTNRQWGLTNIAGDFYIGRHGLNVMFLDNNGNVGIGTGSPSHLLSIGTESNSSGRKISLYLGGGDEDFAGIGAQRGESNLFCQSEIRFINESNSSGLGAFAIATGGNSLTERMRITSGGEVCIGTESSAPSAQLTIGLNDSVGGRLALSNLRTALFDGDEFGRLSFVSNDTSQTGDRARISAVCRNTAAATDLVFYTGKTSASVSERMRITSAGELLKGIQTAAGQGTLADFNSSEMGNGYINLCRDDTATIKQIRFGKNGSEVGSISTTGSTTAYNTSSDYRLKENVVEMTGALDRVSQLKPSRFNFISDADKTVDGFLAHEVQEIVPEAITGEKDGMQDEEYEISPAVYEDVVHPAEEAVYETIEHPAVEEELDDEGNIIVEGKEAYTEEVLVTEAKEEWTEKVLVSEKVIGTRELPDYQGIDQSKLVPLLVGAIQEQQQLINDLKSRIETLENN